MQTDERTTQDRLASRDPMRRRWLIPGVAAAIAIIAVVVVVAVMSGGDEEPDVAVVPEVNGAASLIGTTARVTGGLASPLPARIAFAADGTYEVLRHTIGRFEAIDTGTYQTDGDTISFVSDSATPVWQYDPRMGPADPSVSFSCEGLPGDYRVVPQGGPQFTLQVEWDECRSRIAVARGLELELIAAG